MREIDGERGHADLNGKRRDRARRTGRPRRSTDRRGVYVERIKRIVDDARQIGPEVFILAEKFTVRFVLIERNRAHDRIIRRTGKRRAARTRERRLRVFALGRIGVSRTECILVGLSVAGTGAGDGPGCILVRGGGRAGTLSR